MPVGTFRRKLPSLAVFALSCGWPERLGEANAYTSPVVARAVPGGGPPSRRNVPVTVPPSAGAVDAWAGAVDEEHPAHEASSTTTARQTAAGLLVPLIARSR